MTVTAALSRAGGWVRSRPFVSFTFLLVALIAAGTLYGVTREARHDRNWVEHLSRLPHVTFEEGSFTVAPVRNWSYAPDGPTDKHWIEAPQHFDLDALRNVWLMVEPHPSMEEAMAHTLVLFEFKGDRLLGLTIEARREKDEGYDAFQGNWGKFELLYVWAEARDLLTRRAVMLDHQVQIFPLDLNQDQKLSFLNRVLSETQRIEAEPRHYNTLFSNCTNELAKAAELDWDPAFVATGLAAERLHEMGVIPPSDEPFAIVRDRADVAGSLKTLNLAPAEEFDAALLDLLRARTGLMVPSLGD